MKKYVLLFLFSAGIGADDLTHEAFRPDCTGNLSLNKIADCVLDHSPEFKNSKHELNAIKGRKISAGYLFPSNPIFTVMNSHRKQGSAENSYSPLRASVNGEVMLSQEIYIGGQRKGKLDIADSEFAAQVRRVTVMERETIAGAFSSAINYAGALHEYKLASEISALALDLYKITKARAEKGLIAPIDSDVAGSEAIRSQRIFLSAKRRLETAKGNLTVMMGIPYDSEINILPEISYPSLGGSNVAYLTNEALRIRADKEAADLDVSVAEKKVTLLRRENIPNLTVSAFLQKDGFDENVIGGRLSMPLRFWRDNSGEIAEGIANRNKFLAKSEISSHTIRFEVIRAVSVYNSLLEERKSYEDALMGRLDSNLSSIRKALQNGQLSIREALLSQQSLISLKLSAIQTKTDLALAAVELIRVSGLPFESLFRKTPEANQ